jgi:non-ribosomal peptide synthase protein (TIGR01720 family)
MFNQEMLVLDKYLDFCVIGSVGDIYIGGEGVVRGYFKQPVLTAERFIAHPFKKGERLYKTGDLGRYLPDGNIEFMGRADFQTKIRGYRVELGEIEALILTAENVKKCVVLVREDEQNQKNLIAYVVPTKGSDTDLLTAIKQKCEDILPVYMQPNRIIMLENIPLTANGKVDRKSLPIPRGRDGIQNYQPPKGEYEEALAKIWGEFFGIEKIGRTDNFFTLGGDSIIGIQMVSRAKKIGISFDIRQVFLTPTIEGLVANRSRKSQLVPLQEKITGEAPLIPIQKSFFADESDVNYFNQAAWFISDLPIDLLRLRQSIEKVRNHHDGFRLRYIKEGKNWKQIYKDDNQIFFDVVDSILTDEKINLYANKIQKSLDITNGPIDRLVWFKDKGLLWVIHHLIVDGISWRILLEDLNNAFNGIELPLKTHSYQDWGRYIDKCSNLDKEIFYYGSLNPTDLSSGSCLNQEFQKKYRSITFSKEKTEKFVKDINKSYNTQSYEILLLAIILAIGDTQGNYNLTIDLEGHGREPLESELDLSRTLGWFTSIYPVGFNLSSPHNLDVSIKEVKEQFRRVPEKGVTYGISVLKNVISPVKTDVLFNYLGQWDNSFGTKNIFNFGFYPTGDTQSESRKQLHALEINSMIQNDVLTTNWLYTNYLNEDNVKKMVNRFHDRFIEIVDFCDQAKNYGFTPSDFESDRLSQEDLDSILFMVNSEK